MFFVTRASVEPVGGRELTQAAKVEGDVTHKVTIRFRDGIQNDFRILFEGRTLNIVRLINVEERERRIEIFCLEEG
jgi:SPP1 family predicted phage head-tail adaptor